MEHIHHNINNSVSPIFSHLLCQAEPKIMATTNITTASKSWG